MKRVAIALAALLAAPPALRAVDRYAGPGNYKSQLAAAQPGDRVILAPGTYGHLWLSGKHGAPGDLIQVIAEDPHNPPVVLNPGLEGWQIAGCSYLLFDGIVVQGATEEGIHLQPFGGNTHHIIMRNTTVVMATGGSNTDNWKSDYTHDTLFYNCRAITSADCGFDFVGCHDSLIMRSYMTNNGNSGVHAKGGSYNFGFYKNVFDNAGERNLQFGGNGPYSRDEVAMGNVLLGSPYGVAYTTVRDCDFAYNTIRAPGSAVIRILNENPGGGVTTAYNSFTNNLVDYTCSTWASGPNTEPATFAFADNFWSRAPSLPAAETGTVVGDPDLDARHRPLNPAAKDYGAHAPGMEQAWLDYVNRFAWAWSYASAYEPDAEAGGTYTIYRHEDAGGSVVLDASASYAGINPNADLPDYHPNVIAAYDWDLDGDNVFGEASGTQPVLDYGDLLAWGRGQPGAYDIELAITVQTDWGQMSDWDTAVVVVAEAPPGDADFDGSVSVTDLAILATNWARRPAQWTEGDFNGDDVVNVQDLSILATNWTGAAAGVPEPAAGALLAGGVASLLVRRPQRRRRR